MNKLNKLVSLFSGIFVLCFGCRDNRGTSAQKSASPASESAPLTSHVALRFTDDKGRNPIPQDYRATTADGSLIAQLPAATGNDVTVSYGEFLVSFKKDYLKHLSGKQITLTVSVDLESDIRVGKIDEGWCSFLCRGLAHNKNALKLESYWFAEDSSPGVVISEVPLKEAWAIVSYEKFSRFVCLNFAGFSLRMDLGASGRLNGKTFTIYLTEE